MAEAEEDMSTRDEEEEELAEGRIEEGEGREEEEGGEVVEGKEGRYEGDEGKGGVFVKGEEDPPRVEKSANSMCGATKLL